LTRRRFFFRAGAGIWIAGGIGHFVLVDLLTLHGRTRVSQFIPHGDIIDVMERTRLSFGLLGSTTAFLATAGFSVWVAISLAFLGLAYLLLSGQPGIVLRPFTGLGIAISATFGTVAATCFIYPATMAAALATASFVVSWMRRET
jgi:hypothetical protein